MAQVGDIIEFKDVQLFAGIADEKLNIYHYRIRSMAVEEPISEEPLAWFQGFADTVIDAVIAIQSSTTTHIRLEINNLMDYALDFAVVPITPPLAGLTASEYQSSAVAWSFELFRTTRLTRNGGKRIGAVSEQSVTNNQAIAAIIPTLNNVAAAMQVPLVFELASGTIVTMDPVIVRKAADVSLPPLAYNLVSGAVYRGVGTQGTRKQLLGS